MITRMPDMGLHVLSLVSHDSMCGWDVRFAYHVNLTRRLPDGLGNLFSHRQNMCFASSAEDLGPDFFYPVFLVVWYLFDY